MRHPIRGTKQSTSLAAVDLAFGGTPCEVVAWLKEAWAAKRVCNVNGELAAPIWPTSGILPGDPTSGRVLSLMLHPWQVAMEADGVKPAAYADDRSIKATAASEEEAEKLVEEALVRTASFDGAEAKVEKRRSGGTPGAFAAARWASPWCYAGAACAA